MILQKLKTKIKIGDEFHKLKVIGEPFRIRAATVVWGTAKNSRVCLCQCGSFTVYTEGDLLRGQVKSCGCHRVKTGIELNQRFNYRHGESGSPLHNLWHLIKLRCYEPGQESYPDYGGRGITVCDQWKNSYEAFRDWANANGYQKGLQIDRRDNSGNYEPKNCQFVTSRQNNNNRRNTPIYTWSGETKSLSFWADDKRCKVSYLTLWQRISKGWPFDRALTTPPIPRGNARRNFVLESIAS